MAIFFIIGLREIFDSTVPNGSIRSNSFPILVSSDIHRFELTRRQNDEPET